MNQKRNHVLFLFLPIHRMYVLVFYKKKNTPQYHFFTSFPRMSPRKTRDIPGGCADPIHVPSRGGRPGARTGAWILPDATRDGR